MAVFHCPTKLCSGTGALKQLTEYRAQRVLIVTDSFFSGNGKAAEIGNMVKGAEVRIFDRVIPDPPAALAAVSAEVRTASARAGKPEAAQGEPAVSLVPPEEAETE